ncbi:hypothetical protein EDD86DRAFT_120706 [Gorgonomyces haynaldii]|nr:hypothetical protein EDD86DRAFT_120706 [Gorgonomyces haynaldii]
MNWNRQQEVDALTSEHEARIQSFYTEMNEKDNKLATISAANEELEQRVKDMTLEHQKEIESMNANHETQMNEMVQQMEQQAVTKEKQLRFNFNLQLSNLEKEHVMKMNASEERHNKMIEDLKKQHMAEIINNQKEADMIKSLEIHRLNLQHEDKILQIRGEHQVDIQNRQAQFEIEKDKALEELAIICNEELKEEKDKVLQLEQVLEQERAVEQDLNNKIADLELNITLLNNTVDGLKNDLVQQRAKFETQAATDQVHFEQRMQEEQHRLQELHLQEIEHMLKDFDQAKNFLKKQIQKHQQEIKDAEIKYINREPRDEDVETIARLNKELTDQKFQCHSLSVFWLMIG